MITKQQYEQFIRLTTLNRCGEDCKTCVFSRKNPLNCNRDGGHNLEETMRIKDMILNGASFEEIKNRGLTETETREFNKAYAEIMINHDKQTQGAMMYERLKKMKNSK